MIVHITDNEKQKAVDSFKIVYGFFDLLIQYYLYKAQAIIHMNPTYFNSTCYLVRSAKYPA